jgi:hypothetical protein
MASSLQEYLLNNVNEYMREAPGWLASKGGAVPEKEEKLKRGHIILADL